MRVDTSELPKDNWHHFLRLRDLTQILGEVPVDPKWRVLEIGAGDGVQTASLRKIFSFVQPIDIAPSAEVEGLIVADVSNLPFDNNQFDLIFSSNVLEHVEDIDKGLSELKRVLAPNGMMVHSMPTSVWKTIQILGRPFASLIRAIRMLIPGFSQTQKRPRAGTHGSLHGSDLSRRSLLQRVIGRAGPTIHGTSGNHVSEFLRFRPAWWLRKFESSGLNCVRTTPLFLHSPYDSFPYKFISVREHLSRMGLASVRAYWLRIP